MCGRFTQSYTWRELVELYRLTQPARNLRPRYNIAPTTAVDVVRLADRRPSDSRFPSLEVFERRPRLGPTASLCKGPASENLHKSGRLARFRMDTSGCARQTQLVGRLALIFAPTN